MYCFIGGSGSTGSSLLANVLNRHSKVFCGPETYLFTKHQLFQQFNQYKSEILEGKIKSYAWHRYSKVNIKDPVFGWRIDQVKNLLDYSNNLLEFSNEFFGHAAKRYKKSIWIEKTPSNAYSFNALSHLFDECYLIQMHRNPYDTIASLNRRGFSVYYSTCLYLLNTATALASKDYKKYIPIVYEEMIRKPEQIIKALCDKLNIRFETQMLEPAKSQFSTDIDTWKFSEHDRIRQSRESSFQSSSRFVQEEILYLSNALRISPFYVKKFKLRHSTIKEICDEMGFTFYPDDGLYNFFQLQIDKSRDHLERIIKSYPSTFRKYPILLNV